MPDGRLEAIWIKRAKGGVMDPVDHAVAVEDSGLRGNADQGGWRQVTVIEREVFERLREELGPGVEPAMRRANLMVSGVSLAGSRDRVLSVGVARVLVRGETRPCERMDEAFPGLREALEPAWRGGVFGRVVTGGTIRVGDPVRLEESRPPRPTAGPDSAAQEILGYSFLRIFANDGTIDEGELRFIKSLALRDGVVDRKERAVLSRIFDRVDPRKLDPALRGEIERFREEYGIN